MPHHLYPDFLKRPEEYRQAEKLWETIAERALSKTSHASEWAQWLDTSSADGNPIFSRYCARQNKGFSVTQEEVEHGDRVAIYIYARTRLFGESSYPKPIQHLVIGCELSEEAAAIAERLIEHWADEQTNMHTMTFFVDRVLSTVH